MAKKIAIGLLAVAAIWFVFQQEPDQQPQPLKPAPPTPSPAPPDPPRPRKPWGMLPRVPVGAKVGGNVLDGIEIDCDIPDKLHRRNTASHGLGLCVFTSIHHSALWQNVPALQEFPKWIIEKNIPGGGYPSKVEKLIKQISQDRKTLEPAYLQAEKYDPSLLVQACKSGRMPSVTYSRSPTGRYNGASIAHMVTCVHADNQRIVILDNNYPGAQNYEWMSTEDARRCGVFDWCVILLSPGPPPPPKNKP